MVNIERVRELKNSGMSYSEVAAQIGVSKQYIAQLLADKEARAELIVKSGGRCERCGKESNRLQAHHTDYNSSPDVVLCVKCHKQIHAGMSDRPALTSAQKQARRYAELNAIAQAAGWPNWTRYATAVKRGIVSIAANPAASRANGRRGGRPRKEMMMSGTIPNHKPGDVCNIKSRGRWEKDRVTVKTTWYTTDNGRVYTFIERGDLIVGENQVRKAK